MKYTNYTRMPDTVEELQAIIDAAKKVGIEQWPADANLTTEELHNWGGYIGIKMVGCLFVGHQSHSFSGHEVSYKEFIRQFRKHQFDKEVVANFGSYEKAIKVIELAKELGFDTWTLDNPSSICVWVNYNMVQNRIELHTHDCEPAKQITPQEFEQRLLGTFKTETMKVPQSIKDTYKIANEEVKRALESQWPELKQNKTLSLEEVFNDNLQDEGLWLTGGGCYSKLENGADASGNAIFVDTDKVKINIDTHKEGSLVYFTKK